MCHDCRFTPILVQWHGQLAGAGCHAEQRRPLDGAVDQRALWRQLVRALQAAVAAVATAAAAANPLLLLLSRLLPLQTRCWCCLCPVKQQAAARLDPLEGPPGGMLSLQDGLHAAHD